METFNGCGSFSLTFFELATSQISSKSRLELECRCFAFAFAVRWYNEMCSLCRVTRVRTNERSDDMRKICDVVKFPLLFTIYDEISSWIRLSISNGMKVNFCKFCSKKFKTWFPKCTRMPELR